MRILIPTCITLDTAQEAALQEWAKQFPDPEEDESDCCMTGHLFYVCGSGIGDSIVVKHGKKSINLAYGDDGVIMGEPCFIGAEFGHTYTKDGKGVFHVVPIQGSICDYCGEIYDRDRQR